MHLRYFLALGNEGATDINKPRSNFQLLNLTETEKLITVDFANQNTRMGTIKYKASLVNRQVSDCEVMKRTVLVLLAMQAPENTQTKQLWL